MANTKLTLSADKGLVKRAKRLAASRDTSLSAMVSKFLQALTTEQSSSPPLGPLTRRASGIIATSRPSSYAARHDRDLLGDALAQKYGLTD